MPPASDNRNWRKSSGSRSRSSQKYEGGERRIDVVEFIEIARALGADPVKLFRDFVSEKPAKSGRKQAGR
jgi:hypothetical protein